MRVCPRNIHNSKAEGRTKGPKGMWAMESSVSTPPDRDSTTRSVPSPPAPALCEIWLFEWAWGELCSELSVTATGELGAVVCWSCSAAKILSWMDRRLRPRCVSVLPRVADSKAATAQQHARESYSQPGGVCSSPGTPARLSLSQGAVAAVALGALDRA